MSQLLPWDRQNSKSRKVCRKLYQRHKVISRTLTLSFELRREIGVFGQAQIFGMDMKEIWRLLPLLVFMVMTMMMMMVIMMMDDKAGNSTEVSSGYQMLVPSCRMKTDTNHASLSQEIRNKKYYHQFYSQFSILSLNFEKHYLFTEFIILKIHFISKHYIYIYIYIYTHTHTHTIVFLLAVEMR